MTPRFDNVHILLWLLKDICWLLEWRVFGTVMIVPTLGVAIFLAVRSTAERIFWINLAICFWVTANGYWMVCEFIERDEYRYYAAWPFALGLLSVTVFYVSEWRSNRPGGEPTFASS